jgi:hypothetical protein
LTGPIRYAEQKAKTDGRDVMVYDVEFIRRIDSRAQTLALDVVRFASEGVTDVIIKADELFRQKGVTLRPDGYRIRETDGSVVYEFLEATNT